MTPEERDEMWADYDRIMERNARFQRAMDRFWIIVTVSAILFVIVMTVR